MASIKQKLEIIIEAENKSGDAFSKAERDSGRLFGDTGTIAKGVALGSVMGTVFIAAGKKIVEGLVAPINAAAGFQQSMAEVSAITGATGETFDALKAKAREMGATTKFSASDSAEAIKFLGMAGLSTDEIMTSLKPTLDLAAASGMDLGRTADIASNIMSGMGLSAKNLSGITDTLAVTASNSNTSIEQLGEGMKFVAPAAQSLGIPLADTSAALGKLADAGLQGSIGGTSLNAALRAMVAPSKEAEEAAKNLGLTFVDTDGKLRPMEDVLGDIQAVGLTTGETFKIFGSEGGRAISILTAPGALAGLADLKGKIADSDGAAAAMAATMSDTFEGAMKSMGSATEGLMITIGDEFLPILKSLLEDYITPAIRGFTDFMETVGGLGGMFSTGIDLVTGFGGTFLSVLDGIAADPDFRTKMIKSIGSIFTSGITLLGNWVRGYGLILREFAAIAWAPFSLAFGLVWDVIKTAGANGINAVALSVVGGLNVIIRQVNKLGEVFGLTISEIDFTPITVDAPKTFEERFGEMSATVSQSFKNIGTIAEDMGAQLVEDAAVFAEDAGAAWEVMEEKATPEFKKTLETFQKAFLEPVVEESAEAGEEAGEVLVEEAGAAIEKAAPAAAEDGAATFAEKFTSALTINIGAAGGNLPADLELSVSSLSGSIGTSLATSLGASGFMAKGVGDGMAALASGDGAGALEAIGAAAGQMIGAAIGGPIGAAVGQVIGSSLGKLASLVGSKSKSESRKSAIENLQEVIRGGDIGEFGAFNNLKRSLSNAGSAKLTLQAFETLFGLESEDAADLIRLLGDPDRLRAGGSDVERFNELLGAIEQRRSLALAATLVPAASGVDTIVDRPTGFLTGEGGGRERVTVIPEGEPGFEGSAGGNIFITNNINALDARDVSGYMEKTFAPWLLRFMDRYSARGGKTINEPGVSFREAV